MSEEVMTEQKRYVICMADVQDVIACAELGERCIQELKPIYHFSKDSFILEWLDNLRKPGFALFVAKDNGKVIGGLGAEIGPGPYDLLERVAYHRFWYVEPEARGKGGGKALYEAFEKWARRMGCHLIFMSIAIQNNYLGMFLSGKRFQRMDSVWAKSLKEN